MLVIARDLFQRFHIGPRIVVTVTAVVRRLRLVVVMVQEGDFERELAMAYEQQIEIVPGVTVKLLKFRGASAAQFGIDSPASLRVWRDELPSPLTKASA